MLFWHEDHNRMANLMLAAELQLFRLGVPLRRLDCQSQWRVKLINCFHFAITVAYIYSIRFSARGVDSKITFWYLFVLLTSPLIFRIILMLCFSQELMLISRRIGLLNTILEKVLAREKAIVHKIDQLDAIRMNK